MFFSIARAFSLSIALVCILVVPVSAQLTWDGTDNDWGTAHWTGSTPPSWPDATIDAIVPGGQVTVEAAHSALSLGMTGGAVVVDTGQSLNVIDEMMVDSAASLTVGAGATLDVGGPFVVGSTAPMTLQDGANLNVNAGLVTAVASSGNTNITVGGEVLGIGAWNDGATAGTLAKRGSGSLRIDNNLELSQLGSTTLRVEEGELYLRGADALAGATRVELGGGMFTIRPGVSATGTADDLRERYYSTYGTAYLDPLGPGKGYLARTAIYDDLFSVGSARMDAEGRHTYLDLDETAPNDYYIRTDGTIAESDPNSFGAVWSGTLTVGLPGSEALLEAGEITFATASDDGSVWWIDGELVVDSNRNQGRTERMATVTLGAGVHEIYIGWYEASGGANMEAKFGQGPNLDYDDLTFIDPTDPAQADVWNSEATELMYDLTGVTVAVDAPGSTLNACSEGAVVVGALELHDTGVVTLQGADGGIDITNTNVVTAGPTAVGIEALVAVNLGLVNFNCGGASEVTFDLGGTKTITLSQAPLDAGQGTFRVLAATTFAVEGVSLGGADLELLGSTVNFVDTGSGAPALTSTDVRASHVSSLNSQYGAPLPFGTLTLEDGAILYTTGGNTDFSRLDVEGAAGRKVTLGTMNDVTALTYLDGGAPTTIVKEGDGTLTLGAGGSLSAAATTFEVTRGTLAVTSPEGLAGSPDVRLTGGTLQTDTLTSLPTTLTVDNRLADGLMGSVFFNIPSRDITYLNLDDAAYEHNTTRVITGDKTDTILIDGREDANNNTFISGTTQNWNSFPNFSGSADDFITAFSGTFTARTSGSHNFRWDNDDAGLMYIDLSGDGVFQSSERVGSYAWSSGGSVDLTEGESYSVIYMAHEFAGGASVNWYFTEPGSTELRVDPSDYMQSGLWGVPAVLATSTLELGAGTTVALDELVLVNGDLRITGADQLIVGQVSIDPTTDGAVGLITETDTILTDSAGLNGNGATVTITKDGSGTLTLNRASTGMQNADWRVNAGMLEATVAKPFGPDNTTVTLAGDTATLRLAQTGAIDATEIDVNVDGGGSLQMDTPTSAALGNLTLKSGTVNVNGAPSDVTFAGAALDADATEVGINNAADVIINSPLLSNGATAALTKTGNGQLALAQGTTNLGNVSVSVGAGTLVTGAAMQAANLSAFGTGEINTGANDVTISDGGQFATPGLTIAGSGAAFTIGGDSVTTAGPQRLGLTGGTVTISAGSIPSGLVFHLDASDTASLYQDTAGTSQITADGQAVARWDDLSSSGISVQQSSTGDQPTYQASVASLNGQAALYFDGGSGGDALTSTTGNSTGVSGHEDFTVITVWADAVNTGQNYQHTFHMGDTTTREAYGHSVSRSGGGGEIGNHYWGDGWNSSSTDGLDNANIALSTYDSDSDEDIWWVNGKAVGSRSVTLNIGTDQLQVGSRLTPATEGLRGSVAEILVFDRVLSSVEMDNIGGYLAAKYNISTTWSGGIGGMVHLPDTNLTVSADSTLYADSPTTATFGNLAIGDGVNLTLDGAPGGFTFADVRGGQSIQLGSSVGRLTVTGVLDPGGDPSSSAPGVVTDFQVDGDLTLASGTTYRWEVEQGTEKAGASDAIVVSGDLTLTEWTLALTDAGCEMHAGYALPLFLGFDSVTWDPDLISFDTTEATEWLDAFDPANLRVEYLAAGAYGEGLYLRGLFIPEPSTFFLLVLCGLGLLLRRRAK